MARSDSPATAALASGLINRGRRGTRVLHLDAQGRRRQRRAPRRSNDATNDLVASSGRRPDHLRVRRPGGREPERRRRRAAITALFDIGMIASDASACHPTSSSIAVPSSALRGAVPTGHGSDGHADSACLMALFSRRPLALAPASPSSSIRPPAMRFWRALTAVMLFGDAPRHALLTIRSGAGPDAIAMRAPARRAALMTRADSEHVPERLSRRGTSTLSSPRAERSARRARRRTTPSAAARAMTRRHPAARHRRRVCEGRAEPRNEERPMP